MKKMYAILSLLLCLSLLSCAEARQSEYKAYIRGGTDGMDDNPAYTSDVMRLDDVPLYTVDNDVAVQEKTYVFEGTEYNLEYLITRYGAPAINHTFLCYWDRERDVDLGFHSDTGELVYYNHLRRGAGSNETSEGARVLTAEEREARVYELAERYYPSSMQKLTPDPEEHIVGSDDPKIYLWRFNRFVSGIKTTEGISIRIDEYGNFESMMIYMPDSFDDVEVEVNTEAWDQAIDDMLTTVYDSETSKFTSLTYELRGDYYMRFNMAGDLVLNRYVIIQCTNKETGEPYSHRFTVEIDL